MGVTLCFEKPRLLFKEEGAKCDRDAIATITLNPSVYFLHHSQLKINNTELELINPTLSCAVCPYFPHLTYSLLPYIHILCMQRVHVRCECVREIPHGN